MKITALYNNRGAILAASPVDEGTYRREPGHGPSPVPVAARGAKVGVFAVPETLSKRPLDEICTSLKVDVRSKRLVETKGAKAGKSSKPAK